MKPVPRPLEIDRIRPELLHALDPHQRTAVEALTGPVLVVAGPGSGKTRVLTHRLAALVDAGVYPSRLLAVTFTNKAAKEMKERLAQLIGDAEADRASVSTFHSVCARILRYHHDAANLPARFNILDADDALRVVVAVCERLGHTTGMPGQEAKQVARAFYSDISRAKNAAQTPAALASTGRLDDRATAEVMAAYNAELARMGAVDFDDLLLRVLSLLQNNPEVASQLRARWDFVCVDEFQDTNVVQYEIVANLVAEHRNVCVVGDADQSIYAFRGARPAVVSSFTHDYPDAQVVILERNYRSTAAICETSKAIIAPNEAAFRAQQEPMGEPGAPVEVHAYGSDLDEASAVISKILARGGSRSEHAILVRTNALTRPLEQELTRQRLSYDMVGTLRFVERAEVRDATAWLSVALNPGNWIAFERAIGSPKRGVGPSTLHKIAEVATNEGLSLISATRALGQTSNTKINLALRDFADKVATIAHLAENNGPKSAVEFIVEDAGLGAMVVEKDRREGTSRRENLDQLIAMAGDHRSGDPGQDTSDFLERLALVSSDDETIDPAGKVQILTMHSAKGKEFDHVYVVGCEEEVLPHARALSEGPDAIAEERRLFFVAASRARTTLDISWCGTRMKFGSVSASQESSFLADLPDSVARYDHTGTARFGHSRQPGGTNRSWSGAGTFGDSSRFRDANRTTGSRTSARPRTTQAPTWRPGQAAAGTKAPAAPVERASTLDMSQVVVGTRLRHSKFGDGTVKSIKDNTAVVAFADAERNLMLTVAPVSIIT